jgi:hypothetical protein
LSHVVFLYIFNAVVRHEKHSHAISASGNYSYNSAAAVQSVRGYRHSGTCNSYADSNPSRPYNLGSTAPSSARREACVAPRGMYTRRAAFILRTLVARRGNSAPLRIFSSLLLSLGHAYAAFGSWGLVVPATFASETSAAGNCPCTFRTASVTPLPDFGSCVGKRTALRAFSVCSPEGRYLGSRRPI